MHTSLLFTSLGHMSVKWLVLPQLGAHCSPDVVPSQRPAGLWRAFFRNSHLIELKHGRQLLAMRCTRLNIPWWFSWDCAGFLHRKE